MKRNQRLLLKLSLAVGAIATNLLWNLSAKAQSAIDEISLDPTKQSVSRNTIFFSFCLRQFWDQRGFYANLYI